MPGRWCTQPRKPRRPPVYQTPREGWQQHLRAISRDMTSGSRRPCLRTGPRTGQRRTGGHGVTTKRLDRRGVKTNVLRQQVDLRPQHLFGIADILFVAVTVSYVTLPQLTLSHSIMYAAFLPARSFGCGCVCCLCFRPACLPMYRNLGKTAHNPFAWHNKGQKHESNRRRTVLCRRCTRPPLARPDVASNLVQGLNRAHTVAHARCLPSAMDFHKVHVPSASWLCSGTALAVLPHQTSPPGAAAKTPKRRPMRACAMPSSAVVNPERPLAWVREPPGCSGSAPTAPPPAGSRARPRSGSKPKQQPARWGSWRPSQHPGPGRRRSDTRFV